MLASKVDSEASTPEKLNYAEWQYLSNTLYFIPLVKISVKRKPNITFKFTDEISQKQVRLENYHDSQWNPSESGCEKFYNENQNHRRLELH